MILYAAVAASLDTQLLRTFVTVAEVKSFTRAARLLALTQSATSLQIHRLEELTDAELLHRTKRGVQLTAAGEAFMTYARRILDLQDQALRSVRKLPTGGRLRIGLPDVDAIRYLPSVLERFAEVHPEVQPEVHCDVSTRLVEAFDAGQLDVCLTIKHDHEPIGTVLGEDDIVWVCAPELSLGADEPVPLAVYPEYCVFRAHALRALADAGRTFRIVYTTQSTSAIDIAINRGWAVAIKASRVVEPGWRVLGEEDGLPRLEPVQVELRRSPTSQAPGIADFTDLLESAVRDDLASRQAR